MWTDYVQKCDKIKQNACKNVIKINKMLAKMWIYSIINIGLNILV